MKKDLDIAKILSYEIIDGNVDREGAYSVAVNLYNLCYFNSDLNKEEVFINTLTILIMLRMSASLVYDTVPEFYISFYGDKCFYFSDFDLDEEKMKQYTKYKEENNSFRPDGGFILEDVKDAIEKEMDNIRKTIEEKRVDLSYVIAPLFNQISDNYDDYIDENGDEIENDIIINNLSWEDFRKIEEYFSYLDLE